MIIIIILLAILVPFAIGGLRGAPYVPILKKDSRGFIKLSGLTAGQTLVDLGSGDGRLLRAAAAQGIRCIGYEINPYMVLISRLVCWRYRKLVTIHTADIWLTKLPPADAIYVFLLDRHMARLSAKLETEITQPTLVLSYVFELPGRPEIRTSHHTHVYEYGK